MEILDWLEMSPLGLWVATSVWGYPIVLTLHTIGMGTLVGLALMIALRVLGVGKAIDLARVQVLWRWALMGFVVNLLSGTLLFIANASSFWQSWPLRIKLLLIITALWLSYRLVKQLTVSAQVRGVDKALALTAMICWLSALVAGRLIAYIV